MKIFELRLMKEPTAVGCRRPHPTPSGCRHSGICSDEGECSCPFDTGCTSPACGWSGDTCEQAACVPGIDCSKGVCATANTCRCPRGFHGTSGPLQCDSTKCGDGSVTRSSGEQCDDGNAVSDDGCSKTCQLEELPAAVKRALSPTATPGGLPRGDVDTTKEVTKDTLADTLGCLPEQIKTFTVVDGWVKYEMLEYELRCETTCDNGGRCVWVNGVDTCTCTLGWEGTTCEETLCGRGCDHGGVCAGVNECVCGIGWQGEFCGTVANGAGVAVVVGAGVMSALLLLSAVVVLLRRNWLPFQARGATSLFCSHLGGTAWAASAAFQVYGETFGYSVNSSVWTLWLPLVAGFGVWQASNLAYLRTMVSIHIMHGVPVSFVFLLVALLVPWVVAAIFALHLVAMIATGISFFYCLVLFMQLWPIRADLGDVSWHACFLVLGTVLVALQLFLVHAELGTWNDGDTTIVSAEQALLDEGVSLDAPWLPATLCAGGTVLVVGLHFLATSGGLCWRAVFSANDKDFLRQYHNEYADAKADGKGQGLSGGASRRNFDDMVATRKTKMPDQSFRARVGRSTFASRRAVAGPANALRSASRRVRAALPGAPKPLRAMNKSFKEVKAKMAKTGVGQAVSAISYNRGQFGARRKVGNGNKVAAKTSVSPSLASHRMSVRARRCIDPAEREMSRLTARGPQEPMKRHRRASLVEFNGRMQDKIGLSPMGPAPKPKPEVRFADEPAHSPLPGTLPPVKRNADRYREMP
jgi:cysteine-rich repeat protein